MCRLNLDENRSKNILAFVISEVDLYCIPKQRQYLFHKFIGSNKYCFTPTLGGEKFEGCIRISCSKILLLSFNTENPI